MNNFFRMTTGAEPTPPTTEGKKILVMTVRATDTSKAFSQITALEIPLHDFWNYWTEVTIFPYTGIIILHKEFSVVLLDDTPQWRFLGFPWMINLC